MTEIRLRRNPANIITDFTMILQLGYPGSRPQSAGGGLSYAALLDVTTLVNAFCFATFYFVVAVLYSWYLYLLHVLLQSLAVLFWVVVLLRDELGNGSWAAPTKERPGRGSLLYCYYCRCCTSYNKSKERTEHQDGSPSMRLPPKCPSVIACRVT